MARRSDRKLGRMSAIQVAEQARLSPATMSNLELGKTRIQAATARKLEEVLRWQPGACFKILSDPDADENTYADDPPTATEMFVELARTVLHVGDQVRSDPSHDPQLLSEITERLGSLQSQLMKILKFDFNSEVFEIVMAIDRFLTHKKDADPTQQ